jgi:hypothetical protein
MVQTESKIQYKKKKRTRIDFFYFILDNNMDTPGSFDDASFIYDDSLFNYDPMFEQDWMIPQPQAQAHNDFVFYDNENKKPKKYVRKRNPPQEGEKREQFLERNRQAALKCRQRKKKWLEELQGLVEYLNTDNEQLHSQATYLREEVLNLKTLLLAHVDCKVAQSNGTTAQMIQMSGSTPHKHPHE